MSNQIKAEFLKLKYSRIFKVIPILFFTGLVLYGLFGLSSGGTQLFVSEGDEEINSALHGMIGFFAFTFSDAAAPSFTEIIQSCVSCNVFLWIFVLILTTQFFSYDYDCGTIKLPIAYGISRIKIYFAKVIIIILYSAINYFVFSALTMALTCILTKYKPCAIEIAQYLSYVGINFLVMITFILLCLVAGILLKNIGIVSTVMCLLTLGGAVVYTGIWQNFHEHIILRLLVQLTPFYYWMNMGAFRLEYGIISETINYFLFGLLILLPVSMLIVKRQEFK
ncbi:MAG: ABC transporter permease [Bacteroides sp.]|nr:ABC transporter permease [Bacteroides sp.]MCM1550680.1 ABC transporter permease [Clostridium sp.]